MFTPTGTAEFDDYMKLLERDDFSKRFSGTRTILKLTKWTTS